MVFYILIKIFFSKFDRKLSKSFRKKRVWQIIVNYYSMWQNFLIKYIKEKRERNLNNLQHIYFFQTGSVNKYFLEMVNQYSIYLPEKLELEKELIRISFYNLLRSHQTFLFEKCLSPCNWGPWRPKHLKQPWSEVWCNVFPG